MPRGWLGLLWLHTIQRSSHHLEAGGSLACVAFLNRSAGERQAFHTSALEMVMGCQNPHKIHKFHHQFNVLL